MSQHLHVSSSKAPETDAIPVEIYKGGGLPMTKKLMTELYHCMQEAIPQEFKDAPMTIDTNGKEILNL